MLWFVYSEDSLKKQ